MKLSAGLILLILTHFAWGQNRSSGFYYHSIDNGVMSIDDSSPSRLAQKLVTPYTTSTEKARAIFSWIAQHIIYEDKQPKRYKSNNGLSTTNADDYNKEAADTLVPLNELVAEDVLQKKNAICYGYTRLFKCLCDYAHIPCEIINGYARGDFNKVGNNFRTNHSWNAIYLDNSWHLVDVTWASGYFNRNSNKFIQFFDDQYFLTPPAQFALDHFPDDLSWSLLQQPPAIDEFRNSPYKSRYFVKYGITSYWPKQGVIEASIGDTISFNIQTDLSHDRNIAGGSIADVLDSAAFFNAVYCQPTLIDNSNVIRYTYVVTSPAAAWLQLVYNDDMILRYRLDVKNKQSGR